MDDAAFHAVADRFVAALENGEVASLLSCYAKDAYIWHNFDEVVMTPAQNAVSVERDLFGNFPTREYLDIRRHILPGGLLQQHVLKLTRADGRSFAWPGCIIFEMVDGKITKLEEYVDLASFASAMA